MEESIFTRIIKGDIPCYKIYEDEYTFAFLDIHPAAPGHTLVIPKKQIQFVWDLGDDEYMALMRTVRRVARRQREVLGVPYIGTQIVGVDVPHAHVHLIPFSIVSEFRYVPDPRAVPDYDALQQQAAALAF